MKNTAYVSDIDKFVQNLLQQKPTLKAKQLELRGTWWDKDEIDLEEQEAYNQSTVKSGAYVYFDYSLDK